MKRFIIIILLAVLYPFNLLALTESEYEEIKQHYPDFTEADQYLSNSWKDVQKLKNIDPEKFNTIKKAQIEWIKNGRDIRARQLIDSGMSKYQAYTLATTERASYLADISNVKNNNVSPDTVEESNDNFDKGKNLSNLTSQKDNSANNFGIYGITFQTTLQQALDASIARGCYQTFIFKYDGNAQEVDKIKNYLLSKGVKPGVIEELYHSPVITVATMNEGKMEIIKLMPDPFLIDKKDEIIPINIWQNNAHIESYFYKDKSSGEFLPLAFQMKLGYESINAALNFFKDKYTDFEEIYKKYPYKLYSSNNVLVLVNDDTTTLSLSTPENINRYKEIFSNYEHYILQQKEKEKEIREQRKKQEEQNRMNTLQEGM